MPVEIGLEYNKTKSPSLIAERFCGIIAATVIHFTTIVQGISLWRCLQSNYSSLLVALIATEIMTAKGLGVLEFLVGNIKKSVCARTVSDESEICSLTQPPAADNRFRSFVSTKTTGSA